MEARRWKGQSLMLFKHLTSPSSEGAKQGLLPLYAKLAHVIAASAGEIAGMAKKAWRDNDFGRIPLDTVRSIRSRINAAFDQLEEALEPGGPALSSAIEPENEDAAQSVYEGRGNFAILSLCIMEEASELAVPLMQVAEGSRSFDDAKQDIDDEASDLQIYQHITTVQASIPEKAAGIKWGRVRERFPEVFSPANDTKRKGSANA